MSRTPPSLHRIFVLLTPSRAAFLGSALLSVIAIITSGTLNRDGMLYADTARIFLQDGLPAARQVFPWPFLPVLMAVLSQATGLGLESAGHLLNILFMAGACALLVDCTRHLYPEAAWPICLTLLAIPGLNDYRNELLREYGCWFFAMLSFWLALRWAEMPRWRSALAVQAALILAALFRTEALVFFPALIAWQFLDAPNTERWRRLLMIGALPMLGLATLVILYTTGDLPSDRLAGDLGRLSLARFDAKAQVMSQAFIDYARDQARTILFFGSLAIIPVKFAKKMGIFIVPLLYVLTYHPGIRASLTRSRIFLWAFIGHLLVLMVFVTDLQFVAGRYVALLMLLAAPLTGYGLYLLMQRFPRWRSAMVLLAMLIALANVVSTNPGKRHFIDAGRWLGENATDSPRVYMESPRAAYYAGWRFSARPAVQTRSQLPEALAEQKYDLVILEVTRKEPDIGDWLSNTGLREVKRFSDASGSAVIVAEPITRNVQQSPSKTEAIR